MCVCICVHVYDFFVHVFYSRHNSTGVELKVWQCGSSRGICGVLATPLNLLHPNVYMIIS